jgi:hypothetical protein
MIHSLSANFRRIFLSNCCWQKSDIWAQASYRYTILWVAFLDPSDSYFLFADLNLTGQKTLPTIWGTYMKLVTKYQISAINSYWEKCDEKWAYMFTYFLFADLVGFYTHWTYMHIFRHIFLSNYWWQRSDIWSQASYRYPISWEAFLNPSAKYQISVINSCWEKCDEKCAYMFNVYKNQLRKKGLKMYNYTPAPRRGRGVYCFTSGRLSVRPSARPTYFSSHFSQ